jgi:molecular chaperone GrpE (heat shock protein)
VDDKLRQALEGMIEVVDSCDYALDGLEDHPQSTYRQGLLMIRNKALQRAHLIGLEDFTVQSGTFNTDYHEAVSTMPGGQRGQIHQVLRRGWRFEKFTLRHAQVVVYMGGGPEIDEYDDDDDDRNPAAGRRRMR